MGLTRRRLRAVAAVLALAGAVTLGVGLYLPAKALLGAALLRLAWERTGDAGDRHRPWPWAETWPVARLRVPAHGVDAVVLDGADGESLAWAPGLVAGSARPGADGGNVVLAGHRDTVFRFLRDLDPGDELRLDDGAGGERRYRVAGATVVDERETWVLAPTTEPTLTLVTCYPFDAALTGGPLRYIVRATAAARRDGNSGVETRGSLRR